MVLLLCCQLSANADEPTLADLQTTVDALKTRIKSQQQQLNVLENRIEIAEHAEAAAPALPGWLEGLSLGGDLRLRYQYDGDNQGSKDRHRGRFRLRYGVKKKLWDKQMEVGFRVATGSSSDPSSTNQTFDNYFDEKNVWIDRAYAKYKPNWCEQIEMVGGKMKTPMVHTNLIWDSDVAPEGVWGQYKTKFDSIETFCNVGYFILDESNGGNDTVLATYQGGVTYKFDDVKWTSAITYYDFCHYETSYRSASGNNETVAGVLDAGDFNLINFTNKVSFEAFELPMTAYVDIVYNCGDEDDTPQFTDEDTGYAVGLKVGKNKKAGDCSMSYKYAHIEANSTAGALNDSDFGHANRKGHVVGVKYNLANSITLGGALFSTKPIAGSSTNERDTIGQVDLIWKF